MIVVDASALVEVLDRYHWNWLTNHDPSMFASVAGLRLLGHYWVGPVAIRLILAATAHGFARTWLGAWARQTLRRALR